MAQARRWSSSQPSDRFIPHRPSLNVDLSHARLRSVASESTDNLPTQYRDARTENYQRMLSNVFPVASGRVLPLSASTPTNDNSVSFRFPAASPDQGYFSPQTRPSLSPRRIPNSPECVMDMPGLRDDFYTNLLDWSPQNLIAVALDKSAYVWNADSRECQKIEIKFAADNANSDRCFLTALCWSRQNKLLAIADNEGEITICDVDTQTSINKFTKAGKRKSIGSILWSKNFGVISGSQRGTIILHDHRTGDDGEVLRLAGRHKREVCGLKLEPQTGVLASGGDDGLVNIWDLRMTAGHVSTIHAHSACAKALAWCPWRRGVLASGGGNSDGHIRVWNVHCGDKLAETFTDSQICGLVWSNEYRELLSAHGTPASDTNVLALWNMKGLRFESIGTLHQHTARPLHLALSPDKTTVASAGADEALCLWKMFPPKENKQTTAWDLSPLNMARLIR